VLLGVVADAGDGRGVGDAGAAIPGWGCLCVTTDAQGRGTASPPTPLVGQAAVAPAASPGTGALVPAGSCALGVTSRECPNDVGLAAVPPSVVRWTWLPAVLLPHAAMTTANNPAAAVTRVMPSAPLSNAQGRLSATSQPGLIWSMLTTYNQMFGDIADFPTHASRPTREPG
jgi:hypothetical protein